MKWPSRIPLRWKLVVGIGIPLIWIFLSILVINYYRYKNIAYERTQQYLLELVSHYSEKMNGKFSELTQVAESAASFLEFNPGLSEAEIYELLEQNLRQSPFLYGSAFAVEPNQFDASRRLFSPYVWKGESETFQKMDIGRDAYDYLTWEWYEKPKKLGKAVWTDPYFDEGAGNIIMATYSVPVRRDNQFWGVVTVDVPLKKIQDWMRISEVKNTLFAILTKDGRYVSHPNPELIMVETIFTLAQKRNREDIKEFAKLAFHEKTGIQVIEDYPMEGRHFMAYTVIASTGWTMGIAAPESEAMKEVWDQLSSYVYFMSFTLVILVAILLFAAFRITRPLRRLTSEFQKVAGGDLEVKCCEKFPNDEIGQLATTFYKMVCDLKEHIQLLTNETQAREAVEGQLRVARDIQTSLLPQTFPPFPHRKEFDLHAFNAPAKFVAGDFYDFFFVSEDELVLVIADVSGKGVPAAMFMAVSRTLVRNRAFVHHDPAQVMREVNQTLSEQSTSGLFVTMIIVFYNVKTGKLRLANGGHPLPYLLSSTGAIQPLGESTGTVLGVMSGGLYGSIEYDLKPGESLVFFTDGITEARNQKGDFYGDFRFRESLIGLQGKSPQGMCDEIFATVQEFQEERLHDDMTLLVLKRTPARVEESVGV